MRGQSSSSHQVEPYGLMDYLPAGVCQGNRTKRPEPDIMPPVPGVARTRFAGNPAGQGRTGKARSRAGRSVKVGQCADNRHFWNSLRGMIVSRPLGAKLRKKIIAETTGIRGRTERYCAGLGGVVDLTWILPCR